MIEISFFGYRDYSDNKNKYDRTKIRKAFGERFFRDANKFKKIIRFLG